jgi:hypothetical protein
MSTAPPSPSTTPAAPPLASGAAATGMFQAISAQVAIARAKRQMTHGRLATTAMIVAVFVIAAAPMLLRVQISATAASAFGTLAPIGMIVAWMAILMRSARTTQLAADVPNLIAAGELDLAEQRIHEAMGSFTVSRMTSLLSLHHLALLRRSQRRYAESATLCRAVLHYARGKDAGLTRSTLLMLADATLEQGDLAGCHAALSALYTQRLNLSESLQLLAIDVEYRVLVGDDFGAVAGGAGLPARVAMVEIMPPPACARAHALLALSCQRLGWTEWATFLRRRAELVGDVGWLTRTRGVLRQVWG